MLLTTTNIKEDSHQFEAIFKYAAMGILIIDDSGKITAINPFALKEFGYSLKEVINKKIELLVPPRFHKKHIQHRGKYFKSPYSRSIGTGKDLYAVKKNGDEFPVEINLGTYYDNREKKVIAFISNITVRKKEEAEIEKLHDELEATVEQRTNDLMEILRQLQLSKEALEKTLSFQKAILDNAGVMIIATDKEGLIKLFNPEAALNLGYQESEVVNKKTPMIFHVPVEIATRRNKLSNEFGITFKNDFEVMVEKAIRNIHDEEQYTFKRKGGTSFPVSLTITTIKDKNGAITGFMGIAIDISERKKAEEELRKALENEKVLNELKSRFVSIASHEFRTPLSTVLSSAYLIDKYAEAEDQPKRKRHLQRIIRSVNALTEILNDLLSVSKIEEGKTLVRLTRFNLKELMGALIEEINNTLKSQQMIRYHHEGNPDVLLDTTLMKHIIMNLISNASKFSPEGSFIDIKTMGRRHDVTLSVKDYGMGISPEDQPHLMERFFRGANAGNIQGTGLGLHIISKYAELMNGNLTWKSELEKGTEFIIKFKTKTG